MTPNVNYFDQIDDYCLNQLDAEARVEFETEMMLDAELRKEVKLRMEIQTAIAEMDVTNLRDKLVNVATQSETSEPQKNSFELLTDFSDFSEIKEELSSEELINYFDSMPKVHVHQHEITSNENIHHFYKEQDQAVEQEELNGLDEFELEELDGLEDAILEKDVINFRQTLKQVAKSVEPQYTVEEIDSYLNQDLDETQRIEFEQELEQNNALKDEIKLHKELESAVGENDVMKLRSQMSQIVETETSWNVSEESIEAYIEGELKGKLLAEFKAELAVNSDLIAEVELRKQVNEVIGEGDIRDLKDELNSARDMAETNKVRRLIPATDNKVFKFVRASAAVIVLMLGIASLMQTGFTSSDGLYSNFYNSPQWASERSVSAEYSYMQKTQAAYIDEDHAEVVRLKANAPVDISNNPVFQFYAAASLQNLENFTDAIKEYTQVIKHGDNLYVEEAEWYRSLCYIKLGDKAKAKQELLAVIDRNGHYKQDARAVLRRIKYSVE
jgi:anti-sigma factor RsiW